MRCSPDQNSLRPVARRDAAAVAAELRKIDTAPSKDAALDALAAFSAGPLGQKYPQAPKSGRTPGTGSHRSWPSPPASESCSAPLMMESLNYQVRKVTGARGHFPRCGVTAG